MTISMSRSRASRSLNSLSSEKSRKWPQSRRETSSWDSAASLDREGKRFLIG
jgi:hypothetical protein